LSTEMREFDLTYADTHRFPPPDWVVPSFVAAASGGGMTYTPYRGDAGVRRAVAEHLTGFLGLPVDPERELLLTAGTQGALFNALFTLVGPGDKVAHLDPDYLSTGPILDRLGAQVLRVGFDWHGSEPVIDYDALETAARAGARLLVFSNPNNPTGTVFPESDLRRLSDIAQRFEMLVLIDQLYCRLLYEGRPYTHLAALPGMKERTITLLGPSKTESMSGFRVGVMVVPASLAEPIEETQGLTYLRAPAYAQHTLARWLADDCDLVEGRLRDYAELRDLAYEQLAASPHVEPYLSQGTAYMFPAIRNVPAADLEVAQRLRQRGVIVNPGTQFGPGWRDHLRICFAKSREELTEALGIVTDTLAAMAGAG
jgi:aspartate/methionine/tyrosine aminotransferase